MFKKVASLVIIPLIILLWVRFGAQPLALYMFNALIDYPSPYTEPIAPGKEADAFSKQVVVAIVDALRADSSRTMPDMAKVRRATNTAMQSLQPMHALRVWCLL